MHEPTWNSIVFWFVLAAIFGSILFVGHVNGQDLATCEANGHSREVCFATLNP